MSHLTDTLRLVSTKFPRTEIAGAGHGLKLSTVCNGMRSVGAHPSAWRAYLSWKDVAR